VTGRDPATALAHVLPGLAASLMPDTVGRLPPELLY
jgi:hypothetical protein